MSLDSFFEEIETFTPYGSAEVLVYAFFTEPLEGYTPRGVGTGVPCQSGESLSNISM